MSTKFIILGCGSSMGVPRADGYSGLCNLNNKKNYRSRCSSLIQFNNENILIDTSPDIRQQLLNNKIKSIMDENSINYRTLKVNDKTIEYILTFVLDL